ncbi:MAG: TetR/AcrR family transcriptional regulator [Alphaproteobacteria bacterium]
MKYESETMIARRARIIETALDMMARNDGDFTMRALAKESGVATGTLYNLFGGQEGLVAEAVSQVFEERVNGMTVDPKNDEIAEVAEARSAAAFKEMMRVPAYAKTMCQIYFSGEAGNPVRQQLHDIPTNFWVDQLRRLQTEGALEEWVRIDALADEMTSAAYAVVSRWAAEDLDDEGLRRGNLFVVLTLLAGAVKGRHRESVARKLAQLNDKAHPATSSAA